MGDRIDGLQYANGSLANFRQTRSGGVDAVLNIEARNRRFEHLPDLTQKGRWAGDVRRANETGSGPLP